MRRKLTQIIFGSLLIVGILGATGLYVYFSQHKLSPINEEFCYGTDPIPLIDLP